jgi:CRP-like cAMP-binding protein
MDTGDLRGIPLLEGIEDRDLRAVAALADDLDVEPGAHLISEGSFAHEFFIIIDGSVEVAIGGTVVATLGEGDFFGEVALLTDDRRTASVTTASRCRLAVLSKEAFREVEMEMPIVHQHLVDAATARMSR